ncbi:TetR/AcrR family transcriptional regulator C-terminal domain-containing protein [Antribacter gilvus]|uniref:TetR/AcrR family transcriptional regulator C-terminal domain-containing protein n=1 Tax=Antribacter gilvus TaxID=2304675 RepID=UPI0023E8C5E9|nr:TetR/AcrR family transcriptional regulator C-terminal domain-containing protein [Antribacter gilvus]
MAEAVAIAAAEGLPRVSMKHLAERLGSGVMSLYRHVPGKDELVALMYDSIMSTPPDLPADQGWRAALTAWAHAVRDLFLAHPWALPLATVNHVLGPGEAGWLDSAMRAVGASGFATDLSLASVMAVNNYVGGAVRPELHGGQEDPLWFTFLADDGAMQRFPALADLVTEGHFQESALLRDHFSFGLERLLDGLERYLEPGSGQGASLT